MSDRHRLALVRKLEQKSVIRSPEVRDAFLAVPREIFVPEVAATRGLDAVYADEAHPTKLDDHGNAISSSSQPGIMAAMLEELRLEAGHRVLEIGAGTGYNAALLSSIVGPTGRITSVELDAELAGSADRAVRATGHRADVVVGDGREGWLEGAPYDRIVLTASSPDVPRPLLEQLGGGGLLVMPFRPTDAVPFQQIVMTLRRDGDGLRSISVMHGGFMRLRDRPGDPSLPWPVSSVVETRDGEEVTVASLSGRTWGGLDAETRGRLIGCLLTAPARHPIGMRIGGKRLWDVQVFIAVAAPEERLAGCTRAGFSELLFYGTPLPAILDEGRAGLAYVAGRKTITRVDSHGRGHPERLLLALLREWQDRGRPGVDRLRVSVSFGRSVPDAWRTIRREGCTITMDWS